MNLLAHHLSTSWSFIESSHLLAGLLIVCAFALLAWLVDLVVDRVFAKLAGRSRIELDDAIVKAVRRPLWITILLTGAELGIRLIAPPPPFTTISVATLKSLILIIWTLAINRLIVTIIEDWIRHWRATGREGSEIIRLGGNLSRILLLVGAVFLLLAIWEINITPLLASAGIVGVAVALAAKETLSNFFGGVSVLLDQPYKVGDYIVLDSGERGEVVEIGLRSTRILTRDDVQISIPNSIITNTKIINESAPEPRFRVRIKIGVAYGSDVDQVEAILLALAAENPLVAPEPKPRVRLRQFGDSSLDFELLCWAFRPHDKGKLVHLLNRNIYKTFNAEGITIPFPQRDIYVHTVGVPRTEEEPQDEVVDLAPFR